MAPDKRDQLYDNLINSGKVTENEIGNREEFKNAVKDENSSRQFYKNLYNSGTFTEDELGTEDQFYDAISSDFSAPAAEPEESVQESQPSFADEFQDTINSAMQTVGQSRQAANRIGNRQQRIGLDLPKGDFGRVNLGENRKVTKGKQRLNPETGKLEDTYVTPQGNEYEKRELADLEQNIVDQEEWERNNPKEALRLKIDSHIAELEARQKELTGPGGAPTNVFRNMYAGGAGVPVRKTANDQRLDDITMALNDLKDARTRMDRGEQLQASSNFLGGIGVPFTKDWFNNWKNFGYGIWDTLSDPGLYDFGITDMAKAGMYGRIKRKMESGEELSDSETALALAGMAKAQAEQLVTLPHGYTAGVTTTEMAPFMAQMAMNPASGFGRSFARQAVRKFGKDGIKAVSARVGARVLGNVAEAGVLSNTLQAGKTAADVMRRYTGDTFQYSDDGKRLMIGHYEDGPDGEPVFVEGGKGLAESVWEGEAASIIENFTELGAGGNINKFLGKMAGTKAGQAIGLGYINDLVGKVGATPFARNMKKFMERTHWDGMIEEPMEEEYGIILNSLLTGDNKISDLWDSEQQADIFAGTMWFGGFMAGMNTAAYPFYRRRIKKELSRADLAGQQAFGDEWEVMKAGIDEMDDKQVVQYLYDIKSNDSFNNDQKAAMFAYTSRLKQQQGANTADMLMRMEGNLSKPETDVRNAYDRGVDLEEPQEMNEAKMNLEIQQQRLGEMLEGFDLVREEFEKNPLGALEGFVGNENWTPEEKQTAIDYVNARMTYDGMLDGVRDDIGGKIEASNALIDKRTNPTDNMLHHATTKTDDDIYIIGGTVVMDESGANVDVEASIQATGGDNMILAIDTSTGKVKSYGIDEIMSVDEPMDAAQMKQEAADNIRQITAREAADKIDGRLTFQPDDQYQVIDEEGAAHTIQIVADNGDGTVEAIIDGAGEPRPMAMQDIQVMADRYNQQRVIMQQAELQAKHAAESEQGGILDNAAGEESAPAEDGGQESTQQQSALDRIPVVSNEQGEPILNRKGEVTYLWHEAPVEDTTDALVGMTEGDMVMARDTAASMIENAKADLQKANKLKATGSDPLSIINSRKANAQAVQQAQAIVKYWQDVNTAIRKRMEAESAARLAEIEAAKSAEQKAREAEEARIRKEEQDKRDRERLREQIERDRERRTQPYQPIVDARRELSGDSESLAILDDLEPRSLEEWVSSLLSPHSMLWLDASDAEVGLQTELGLKRADMQRFMQLLGTKESGAKPFGKVVLDIYEALPEGMKNQYDSEDVRRVVLDMFQSMENSTQMMHLTELNRISEARQTAQENERRDQESEMEAWAKAYHLTPEERTTFADFMSIEPPYTVEENIINQIIADNEQNRTSAKLDITDVSGGNETGIEGGEGQVQTAVEAADNGNPTEGIVQGAEAVTGESPAVDDSLSGEGSVFGEPKIDVERSRKVVSDLAAAYASGDPAAIQQAADALKAYVDEGGEFEGYYQEEVDDYEGTDPQMLADQYKTHVLLDHYLDDDENQEYIRTGLKPSMRQQEKTEEPIGKTSSPEEIAAEEAKVDTNPTEGQKEAGNYQKGHINIDGYDVTIENPKGSVRSGVDGNGNAWEQETHNTYGYIRGTEGVDGDHIDVFLSDNPTSGSVFVVDQINPDTLEFDEHKVMYGFPDAESAESAYLSNYEEGWGGLGEITEVSREEFKKWVESSHRKTKPFSEYKSVKPQRPSTDSPEGEILVNGGTKLYTENGSIVYVIGSNIDKNNNERAYTCALYENDKEFKNGNLVTKFQISQKDMRQNLENGTYSKTQPEKQEKAKPEKQHKRIVSDDKMEELRKQLLAKFNNLNSGIDVERMLLGAMYAVGKIERGVTKFADYAREMVEEIGDGIRPYLKAFYEAVRNMPEAAEYRDQMTSPEEVAAFDEYNFDKAKAPDTFTKAEQVVRKQKAKQQVKKIEKEVKQKIQQGDLFAGDLFAEQPQQEPINGKPKPKTAWWNDPNRPQSLDPSDYKTYMTDEAKAYFAQFKSEDGNTDFTKWVHPNLAYITAAAWDGADIPVEELMQIPEIAEAEQRVKAKEELSKFRISKTERHDLRDRLLDAEHGSAVFENGKLKKVDGKEDFSGPVRQEKKAFLVVGRPAGGKSSVFANRLSNENGARIVDSDIVKPWLSGYDDGYGAGYVQLASADVASSALKKASDAGDNIVMPRIGGPSVIKEIMMLREKGYDVQIFYNDVSAETSIMRAASRFAQEGRYLSLDYLTTIGNKDSDIFRNFATAKLSKYYGTDEREGSPARTLQRTDILAGRGDRSGSEDESLRRGDLGGRGSEDVSGVLSDGLRSEEHEGRDEEGTSGSLGQDELIFSYAEWKSNDVPFGEKPKEIWNSKSGKPMPGTKKTENDNVQSEQRLPGEPSSSGEGEEQEGRGSERSGAERGPEQDRAERSGRGRTVTQEPAKPKQAPKHNNKRNNVGERGKDYAPTTPKARFNANVEAIKLMRELMDEGVEAPTKEQMEVLRKYSGWGGLGTFFNDATTAEYRELRDLLTEEEYKDAVMSINSAYYTPATVIDTLWDIAGAMGFDGGNVLEGSAGIGNIIGQMPRKLSSQSNIEAVEIDKISGNILKLLYPDAKVHIEGFQDVTIPNGSVDLAITNVPFVTGLHVFDKVDKDLSRKFVNIHDFCIAKNIRKLREGGIGIFISSAGTLDKSTDLRAWIIDEGQSDVVGAFRLNNDTFGGTNVTSDIIVVRKRVNNEKSPNAIDISKASPMRIGSYTDKFEKEHQTAMTVNDYFQQHPEMMAGEMFFGYEKGDTFRPGSYGLYPTEGKNQDKMMADFAKGMKKAKEVPTVSPVEAQKPDTNQLTEVKEGRMLIDDKGRLCVSQYGQAVPLGLNDQKVKGQTKQQCFKDYQDVQKAVDDVLKQQLNDPDDTKLEPKLKTLNAAYDKFVKRYGTLLKNTAISFLRNDIDFPSFQALENYSETMDMNGKVKVITSKTPIFSKRVLGFKTEPQPKTVKDAVIASMFRTNGIDLEWIAAKLSEVAAPPNGDNWTADDVRKGILVSRLGFEDPATGQVEIRYKYLSGNVREKLAMAEAYNTDGRYNANVEELRKAVPMDIPSHLIEFSLGSSWIPEELYKEYLKENYDLSNVKLTHVEGNWVLDEGWGYRNEKNRAAGVYSEQFRETIYGHQLVAAALNNRPVKVAKQVTEGWGSSKTTKTVVDKNATQACAVRVDEIKDEFRQWAKKKMQEDPELAQRIEKIYNEKFNALVPMEIDKEFLPDHFEGSNVNITLRPHQKTGAMRGLTAPTMLAHEVGTGKSFTLITTAMEMRRLGTARKPMLVVQNATVAQLTSDAKLLYPNAKVLSLTERDRDAEGRRAFYAKIKYNDWDLIIIPQSTFERIPDSPERELQFIQEKIDEKKHVIEAAMQSGMDAREIQRLKKELEKMEQEYGDTYVDRSDEITTEKKGKKKDAKKEAAALDKAETKAKEQLDRATDDVQYFDDLGVDALLVDEAHEYKHLGFQTSIGRGIKGIDPSYSKKCAGLYNKTRSVFEQAGWKNVVFATGTPISNTAAEIWTFMKYLMPADVMRANDIYYFDDFVHNFGAISQMLEFATSGKFKENTRFAAYVNRPELIRIWTQVADIVLSRDSKEVLAKLPQKEGGKDQDVFLPQSPSLVSIMAAVRAELDRFENMTGQEKKENSSIPLTMYGIAKRAAIDPRLVNPDAPDEPMSKTNAAVKEIVKDLKDTDKYKGTVAVFCDNQNRLGTNAAGKKVVEFNIYDDMKDKLVKAGVPESQIAIIKSGMSITAKQKIFDAVNSGAIRVVLGSTQTLGTGVNMQERLHLLIHMDAPDRPMDYTQRNGRIERQGNLHKEWGIPIRIVRFGVEDSLDVTAYQRLKTKSGFIDSIMDGKSALANNQVDRTVEEEEEGLFDNPVAVLSGSQYALKKNQAERELRKYLGKKAQWQADQVYVANQLRRNANTVKDYQNIFIPREEAYLANIKKLFPEGKAKSVTIEGVKVDLTKDDAEKKLNEVIKEKINDSVNAIVKRNRENAIYNDETLKYKIKIDDTIVDFLVSVVRESEYDKGSIRTVIHRNTVYKSDALKIEQFRECRSFKDGLQELLEDVVTGKRSQEALDRMNAEVDRINKETKQLEQRVGMEFQYDKELEQAQKNVEEYTELMKKEMEEKEAKYAAQQKEAKENGGFDLNKAEDSEDEDDGVRYRSDEAWDNDTSLEEENPLFRDIDMFAEGQTFPIHVTHAYSDFDVTSRRATYQTDLLPDEYTSLPALLDAVRNAYPAYYATIEDGDIIMQSWNKVLAESRKADKVKNRKGTESYVERKTRRAIEAVNDLAQRMHLDVEVLTTTDGLTGKKARRKGWFNPRTNKIVIVLPNHTTKSDVINTLLHEGVAHYGLRKMFGRNFEIFLDNVYNNVSPEIKARIDAAMKRNGWGRYEATEEYLARLAEHTDFENATMSGWWHKIKDFFMEMLAKAGFSTTLSDNELRYILWRSYDNLLHPDSRRNIFDTARDIQMKSRLKVGDFAERIRIQRTGKVDTSPMVAAAERVNEEMLNRDLEDVPSQELLLSLSQKEGDERNEAINELVRRVREGDARIVRMGQEVQLDRGNDAQIAGTIIGGWELELSSQPDGALRGMVQGGSKMVSGSGAQGKDTASYNELPIISWAKATGHYYDEEQVKQQSLDKDVWHSGAESRVYRTADGKKVIKFMESWVFFKNPLLKHLDDIALQNAAGFDHLTVLGYSLDANGSLHIVLEQDYVDGVTVDDIFDDEPISRVNDYIDSYLENVLKLMPYVDDDGNPYFMKDGIVYTDIHGGNMIVDKNNKRHIIDCCVEREGDRGRERGKGFSIEDNDVERYSLRTKEPPKKTGKGYKVFVLKDGQLYPPMVANPNGEGTPIGVWLDADAAPIAGQSKTGRPQVKAGGKGTQGGSGQLAYRPGWHLGTIPYALQFNRKDADGERSLFPNNFVWAEVEYADDIDYQDEAYNEGVNDNGKFQHSLAGLKRVPTDGSYKYRTNPDPRTDEWVITGAMRVNRILSREEVDDLVRKAGREPQKIQDGDILTQDIVDGLNAEIKATEEADEMGLLYRDDDSWDEEPTEVETSPVSLARRIYEDAVKDTGDRMMITALWNAIPKKKDGRWNTEGWERFKHKFAESWLDYTRSIKALQEAIEKVTGKTITDFEDVWRSLNAKSSIDNVEIQAVMDKYIAPLSEHIAKMVKGKRIDGHEMTIDDVEKYLNAVHGPERNIRMAMKQAQEEYDNDTELLRQQLDNPLLDPKERDSLKLKLLKKEARFNGIKNYMTIPAIAQWWNQWRISVERQHNAGDMTDEQYAKAKEKMQMEYQTGWKYKYRDRDYSGLTALFGDTFGEGEKVTEEMLEQAARDYAAEFEDVVGKDMADELWDLVKALNNYSLRKSYISGLISKQQYDDTLSMYEHYVPLRGWHDDYAGDVYQYISRGEPAEVLQGVLKKAYGRKSRAARILGTMAAMANTAIVQGNKNRVAQKLMNLASRSGDAGLLMLTEQWYQKDAHDNLVPLFPDLREDMTAEEMQDEIIRFEEDMKERAARNEVQQLKKKFKKEFPLKMAKWQEQRHAVRVMRNGKEYMVYVLGDPKAAEAFNGMLNPHSQLGAISNVLSKYMRFRAKWQTSLSPEFLISNFQRDVMTASTGAYVKYGKQVQKQFVKNLAKVMPFSAVKAIKQGRKPENVAGIFSLLKKYDSNTIDRNNETERLFDEFVRNGGMTGISYITRAEEYQASMEDVIRRMRQGKLSMPGEISKAVGDAVEFANKGIENATRFAMYMTSRQNGKTIVESIFDAKEASVNFNMKGSGAWGNMMARRLYLYVNPAMQALRMLGTWYENDPLVAVKEGGTLVTKEVTRRFMKAAAMTLTASAGLAVVNILLSALFGHGDGDDDDSLPTDWWGLSEWNRYNYVNIINPFSKGYFHWSIPQEMRPLWALGQIGVDLVAGKVTPQHALNSMLAQLNNLSPLSFIEGGTSNDDSTISSLIRTFTPTFVGEFTDAYGWNRDFMGNRITNQMEWNKDAPEWQRASDETPAVFINTSRRVNELLGGRYNRRSRFESRYANPSALYYILTQQYGGIGSMAKRFLTLADQAFDPEEEMEIRNIPFLPKFYVSTGDDYSMNRMMNEKFRIYWDEFKDAEYELAADRRKVAAGEMTQEEADKTIEERKADGTYNTWRIIEGNNLDNIYNQFKGTKKQGEVRQMIVDAVENGTLPDFEQYRSNVDDVTDDDLDRAFDDAEGATYRRLMARRISKQEDASKDPYGSRSDKEYNTLYQELRTAEDVREDAELLRLQEDAKQQGDNDRAEEISKERQRIRDNIRGMERGDKAGNEQAMRDLREDRRRLLTQYGIKR